MAIRKRLVLHGDWPAQVIRHGGSRPSSTANIDRLANNLYYFDNSTKPAVFELDWENYKDIIPDTKDWVNPGSTVGSLPRSAIKEIVEEEWQ